VNGTFTVNLRGAGSDGSIVSIHLVDHFNARPDGAVNEFFRLPLARAYFAAPPVARRGLAEPPHSGQRSRRLYGAIGPDS